VAVRNIRELFAEAASTQITYEEKVALYNANAPTIPGQPPSDDEVDQIAEAVIKQAMRAGRKEVGFGVHAVNAAGLEVMARRYQEAGFRTEVELSPKHWWQSFFYGPYPNLTLCWDPSALASSLRDLS